MKYLTLSKMHIKKIQEIIDELIKVKPQIIAIDGEDGVGKTTTIAPAIASALGAVIFSVDDYLGKEKGGYSLFINYKKLKLDVAKVQRTKPIILEGVITSIILEKLGLTSDYFIYVCSQAWHDDWLGEDGNYSKSFEEVIFEIERRVNFISIAIDPTSKWTLDGLRKEMYRYTYEENPFKKAQSILIIN